MAVLTLSGSRISPTMMMSGSWRRAFLKPSLKLPVSKPTSRCEMMERSSWKMYSIGSSIVMMRRNSLLLMCSIIDAIVVDLPLPVVPPMSTIPRWYMAMSPRILGRFRSSKVWIRFLT